jgi:hypothetical protein
MVCVFICCLPGVCFGTLSGPYFGQEPPGLTPEVFAPGVICFDNRYEQNSTFTPDGQEFCFAVTNSSWSTSIAWHTRQEQGIWTTPARAAFAGSGDVWGCNFSWDGEGFYFASSRPSYPPTNLWRCQKTSSGWSAPVKLNAPVSSSRDEWGCSVLADKTIYLCSHRTGGSGGCDIWVVPYVGGQYTQASNIAILNTSSNDCAPFIAPDQQYLIFDSVKPGGYGSTDLYITFRSPDGSWTAPQNLGSVINSTDIDMGFSLSPDGKYGFFTRRSNHDSDIYWVDMCAILPDPNGPIENTGSGQRFGSIQCAINYAQAGDKLVLQPGIYLEDVTIDKDILVQSADPNDPFYIGGTIVQGTTERAVVTLTGNTEACLIAGLTVRTGSVGITGMATYATIRNCRIMDNLSYGVELAEGSCPTLNHCLITANGGTGITMHATVGRHPTECEPLIENCIIVDNGGQATDGGQPTIVDSILD